MHVTPLVWVVTLAVLALVLVIDVIHMARHPHEPSMKECGLAITGFVTAAVLFGLGIGLFARPLPESGKSSWHYAVEFFSGYLTEYSLSIDNLFVFIIILGSMRVPRKYQQFALMAGIILALIFRGIFIALGAAIINQFAWVFFIFGAFLLYTGVKLVIDYRQSGSEEEEHNEADNAFMRFARRVIPSTDEYHGDHLSVKIDGKRLFTPMFFVILTLGSVDLMFALDSIPAIFGLTQEPYLVFTANFFALMGLRQLYFLLGGLLQRLVYLSLGLAFILCFIAVKLVLHALHHYNVVAWEVPTALSLIVIVVTIAITAVLSLLKTRREGVTE
ncbi:TerC family protein [Brooklawnia cerclae]|uniref:Tellurite resistance protein TerC n=1 Tax=Brooklawnia cerclae TaxID=349934 RepID=A0ABX0SGI3_9ACTN|nr:TerC family protein [Brooklawnia cerclae]NIH57493.1 tellurite resistance protein TerC [Brooklawnia cerclae]